MGLLDGIVMSRAKRELLRELIAYRAARGQWGSQEQIDGLSSMQLLSAPEGTIATIVETYAKLVRGFVPPYKALAKIEQHRASLGAARLAGDESLLQYIAMRLDIEHLDVPGLDLAHVKLCLARSSMVYGLALNDDDDWKERPGIYRVPDRRERCADCDQAQQLMAVCRTWADGDLTDEDLIERIAALLD